MRSMRAACGLIVAVRASRPLARAHWTLTRLSHDRDCLVGDSGIGDQRSAGRDAGQRSQIPAAGRQRRRDRSAEVPTMTCPDELTGVQHEAGVRRKL
jgi:hypothetical protein